VNMNILRSLGVVDSGLEQDFIEPQSKSPDL
jgi:hypothetical protein